MFKTFKNRLLKDNRGFLHKVYNEEILKKTNFKPVETFFSNYSKPNVIRGIYMQTGKYCEAKLLTLLYGDIRWLILDLRKKSNTYLNYKFIKLKKNIIEYKIGNTNLKHIIIEAFYYLLKMCNHCAFYLL